MRKEKFIKSFLENDSSEIVLAIRGNKYVVSCNDDLCITSKDKEYLNEIIEIIQNKIHNSKIINLHNMSISGDNSVIINTSNNVNIDLIYDENNDSFDELIKYLYKKERNDSIKMFNESLDFDIDVLEISNTYSDDGVAYKNIENKNNELTSKFLYSISDKNMKYSDEYNLSYMIDTFIDKIDSEHRKKIVVDRRYFNDSDECFLTTIKLNDKKIIIKGVQINKLLENKINNIDYKKKLILRSE